MQKLVMNTVHGTFSCFSGQRLMKTEPIDVCQTLKPVAMIRMLVMTMLVVNIIQVIDISTNVFVFTIIIIGIIFVNEVY